MCWWRCSSCQNVIGCIINIIIIVLANKHAKQSTEIIILCVQLTLHCNNTANLTCKVHIVWFIFFVFFFGVSIANSFCGVTNLYSFCRLKANGKLKCVVAKRIIWNWISQKNSQISKVWNDRLRLLHMQPIKSLICWNLSVSQWSVEIIVSSIFYNSYVAADV